MNHWDRWITLSLRRWLLSSLGVGYLKLVAGLGLWGNERLAPRWRCSDRKRTPWRQRISFNVAAGRPSACGRVLVSGLVFVHWTFCSCIMVSLCPDFRTSELQDIRSSVCSLRPSVLHCCIPPATKRRAWSPVEQKVFRSLPLETKFLRVCDDGNVSKGTKLCEKIPAYYMLLLWNVSLVWQTWWHFL